MAEKKVIEIDVTEQGLNDVVEKTKSLKQQMREAQAEVASLSDKFGATSEQAVKAARKAAELKDKIQDAKALTDAFNPDGKFKSLSASIGGALSGLEAYQGAMGLVGVDSEKVQETLLKVQSAMAFSQGVQGLLEAKDSFKQFGAVASSALMKTAAGQKILTLAQAAGAVTMRVLNTVMKANPIFLIIGGITALVGAFAYFTSSSEDATEEAERFTKALEKQREAIDANFDSLEKSQGRRVELMKAQGKSAKEIFEQEQKDTKALAESKMRSHESEGKSYAHLRKYYRALLLTGHTEEAEKIAEQLKTSEARYKQLGKQAKDYYTQRKHDAKIFDAEQKQEEKDKEKELAEKQKEANQKAQQKRDEAKQKKNEELAELAQAQLEATKTANELEIIEITKKYDKLIAIAKKYGRETKDLEAKKSSEIILAQTKDVEVIAQFIEQEQGLRKQRTQDDIDNSIKALTIKSNLEQKARDDKKALDEKEAQDRKDLIALQVSTVKGGFDLLGELATTFAKNNEKAQRRAFNIQKAANIASALIDTYTAASGVFRDTKGGLPIRIAATSIAVGAGLARVAQIAKTQFNSSNAGGGGGTQAGSVPQETQQAPNFNIVGNAGSNPLAQLGNAPLQAYVVSGEVTSAQSLDRNRIVSATL